MDRSSKFLPVIVIIALALVLGGLVGWWFSRSPSQPEAPVETVQTPDTNATATNTPIVKPEPPTMPVPPPVVEPVTEVTASNWEDKLDDVLGNEEWDTDVKAEKLANMVTTNLPPAAQKEIAEHLINLVADEHFNEKAAQIMTNPETPEDVSKVLADDLFNRDECLSLPNYLAIARNPAHPLQQEALDNLEMLLQEDCGTNWVCWETAIKEKCPPENMAPASPTPSSP